MSSSSPSTNTIARKPSNFGSYAHCSPTGRVLPGRASWGSSGGLIGSVTVRPDGNCARRVQVSSGPPGPLMSRSPRAHRVALDAIYGLRAGPSFDTDVFRSGKAKLMARGFSDGRADPHRGLR